MKFLGGTHSWNLPPPPLPSPLYKVHWFEFSKFSQKGDGVQIFPIKKEERCKLGGLF